MTVYADLQRCFLSWTSGIGQKASPSTLLITYCAAANLACWGASLAGQLKSSLVVWLFLLPLLFFLFLLCRRPCKRNGIRIPPLSRFKRFLPLSFLLLWLLAAIGATLYHPNNYDHLTYRFPRLLHYWAEGHWHWIGEGTSRLNYSGIGFEWSWYPFFALFKSDWAIVILNLFAFASLPSQTFRFLRFLGVGAKISRIWMWVLPAGYGYVAQAGSAGNDLIGAFFFLVAINSAFFAAKSGSTQDFCICILASALLTAMKPSNIPLLLPVSMVCIGSGRKLFGAMLHPRLLVVTPLAIVISGATLALLNIRETGVWTGDPANSDKLQISNPIAGLAGNTVQLAVGSIWPPVNPLADHWNETWPKIVPRTFRNWLQSAYPRWKLETREMQGEEDAGLGLGIVAMLVITWCFSRLRTSSHLPKGHHINKLLLTAGIWIAFLAFLGKMGSENAPRILLPYYPAILGTLLSPFSIRSLRLERSLRIAGGFSILSAVPILILTPSRPLWPWHLAVGYLPESSPIRERVSQVYETYANRWDAFAPLKARLPANSHEIGFVSDGDDPEASLWRPFGSRRIIHISEGRDLQNLPGTIVTPFFDTSPSNPAAESVTNILMNYHPIANAAVTTKVSRGPQVWTVWQKNSFKEANADASTAPINDGDTK